MDNTFDKEPITPDSVLKAVREMITVSRVDFDKKLEESRVDFDKKSEQSRVDFEKKSEQSRVDFDKKLEESRVDFDKKSEQSRVDFDKKLEESRVDFNKKLEQSRAEAERRSAEADKEYKKLLDMIKRNNRLVGGMCNSNGDAAQEFFYNTLKRKKIIFGEKFDLVIEQENRKSIVGYEAEYDIIMFNGNYICIVEVKYKADEGDIQSVLRKIITFRVNFPEHKDKKIFLALAGMSFHKNTEKACKDNGIAIIKQVGDTIEVYDENLKTF